MRGSAGVPALPRAWCVNGACFWAPGAGPVRAWCALWRVPLRAAMPLCRYAAGGAEGTEAGPKAPATEDAIRSDERLSQEQKAALIAVYRSMLG